MTDIEKVLNDLKQREPIFHHPNRYGKNREDIELMMVDDYWEVGASGRIYKKEEIIETLLDRYHDPNFIDDWATDNFNCRKIAESNYLLTYDLIQDKVRKTRRATLWRWTGNNWVIVYHQGTVIN